jgi:hypothetical protein
VAGTSETKLSGRVFLVGDRLFMAFVTYDSTVADKAALDVFVADFDLSVQARAAVSAWYRPSGRRTLPEPIE